MTKLIPYDLTLLSPRQLPVTRARVLKFTNIELDPGVIEHWVKVSLPFRLIKPLIQYPPQMRGIWIIHNRSVGERLLWKL